MNLYRMYKHTRKAPRGPVPWRPNRKQPPPGDRMRKQALALAADAKRSDQSAKDTL